MFDFNKANLCLMTSPNIAIKIDLTSRHSGHTTSTTD